jgi:hypothetical protein
MIWTFSQSGVPTAPHAVFRLDSYWACETPEGVLELAGALPWGQLPSFCTDLPHKRIHYTPFRAWHEDHWYDGPEFYVADGAVQACVLPGTQAPLPSGQRLDGFAEWLQEHEVLAWKKSLAQALRARYDFFRGSYRLLQLESHPSHALVLLGLRLAFPQTNFVALDFPVDRKPQWKRYCQNLNLSTWAAPSQLHGLPELDVSELSRPWPEASACRFLNELKGRIPFVPGKLTEIFSRP